MTPLIYILAPSHSGSTLLAMLLGRHPEVCTVGELKATSLGDIARYRCSCGQLILECTFWQRVSTTMENRGFQYQVFSAGTDVRSGMPVLVQRLLRPLHRGPIFETLRDLALSTSPTWRRRLPEIKARNAALAATLLELTRKKILVDSSKIGIRLKYLLQTPGLDVRVVRLIRDGRAVALTYTDPANFADAKDHRLKEGGMGGDHSDVRRTMARAAREWRRSVEEGEQIVRRLGPDRYIELRYEELCGAPEETLGRVFRFIGVDPNSMALDFRNAEHHVIGNGMVRRDSCPKSASESGEVGTVIGCNPVWALVTES